MKKRDQWGSRIGFIMAAVGSAIGLGNIWRFPYMAYENGGGAFLIPYFFAMLTAGIPLLILEFGAGHKFHGAAPKTFAAISRRWEWLGWWQVLVAVVISIYYVAVIGWAISYLFLAGSQGWGAETGDFFFKTFLGLADSPLAPGPVRFKILAAVAAAWVICWAALMGGIKRGIEVANKIFMPLLFIMVVVIMARALTLPGAREGVNFLFQPDFAKLMDIKVWVAAYGQIFFSLSIGFGIMVTYSSYLGEKSDINNNAFMTAFINCGFSMLAGMMIFAVLGYMAESKGVPVGEVVSSGVGLAFITIPQAINFLPAPALFGSLFFLALIFAGLSSQISICEVTIAAFMDKFSLNRKITVTAYCLIGFALSVVFTTGGGLLILDIVDHFINNFGILFGGLAEIVLLAWFFKLRTIRDHVNRISDFTVGAWWTICLKVVTPLVLGYMVVANLLDEVKANYGGYPDDAILYLGWFLLCAMIALALAMQTVKARDDQR